MASSSLTEPSPSGLYRSALCCSVINRIDRIFVLTFDRRRHSFYILSSGSRPLSSFRRPISLSVYSFHYLKSQWWRFLCPPFPFLPSPLPISLPSSSLFFFMSFFQVESLTQPGTYCISHTGLEFSFFNSALTSES